MRFSLLCCGILIAGLISRPASAALSPYSDDFQGYGSALFFTPWGGFSDNGGFPGGYGFSPSTSGPQITALANDGAGNDFLNFYGNYDNAPVQTGQAPNPQEAISVFIQQSFSSAEAATGATWTFDFDYKEADSPFGPGGATQVGAFIRVFDGSFNLLDDDTLNTAGSTTWQGGQLQITLNPAYVNGGIIQFGFNNLVGSYEPSGMNYDNVVWQQQTTVIPEPASFAFLGLGVVGLVARRRRRS